MFAFKSPQSCAVLRLAAWLPCSSVKAPDWTSFDIRFISNPITLARYTARALAWLDTQFAHSRDAVNQITLCMHDVALPVLQQLATELLNGAKRKRHTKPRRVDAESFEKFAEQVLSEPDVEEAVVRDIVTAVYLDHRLHVDHRRDDAPIVERRVRVLNASHRPVPSTLFYSAFKDLAISPELRWQKAMLLRTLLVQRRMQDPSAVAAEALDVCIHHGDFSDEDLESFFDAVYAWIGRDAGHREYVAQRIVGCVNRAISSERDSVGRFVHFLTRQGGS
ncbi:hypothetical protein BD779DRAFT_1553673 [Infundibulicybe gibba]|nr:hypothetical protein BD779DRAFT_1553673 [Infundibulicybe gibba]